MRWVTLSVAGLFVVNALLVIALLVAVILQRQAIPIGLANFLSVGVVVLIGVGLVVLTIREGGILANRVAAREAAYLKLANHRMARLAEAPEKRREILSIASRKGRWTLTIGRMDSPPR
jgi:type VI protein secretion system component VasK